MKYDLNFNGKIELINTDMALCQNGSFRFKTSDCELKILFVLSEKFDDFSRTLLGVTRLTKAENFLKSFIDTYQFRFHTENSVLELFGFGNLIPEHVADLAEKLNIRKERTYFTHFDGTLRKDKLKKNPVESSLLYTQGIFTYETSKKTGTIELIDIESGQEVFDAVKHRPYEKGMSVYKGDIKLSPRYLKRNNEDKIVTSLETKLKQGEECRVKVNIDNAQYIFADAIYLGQQNSENQFWIRPQQSYDQDNKLNSDYTNTIVSCSELETTIRGLVLLKDVKLRYPSIVEKKYLNRTYNKKRINC